MVARWVMCAVAVAIAATITTTTAAGAAPALRPAAPRHFSVHNPHNASVHTVYLVQSAHFDGGCKTFGCSAHRAAGEPDLCQANGNGAEPYAYHIANRWFDEYFPRAVAYADSTRGTPRPYRHLVQPWLASLFFDCEDAGLVSWPGSGWAVADSPVLHCPNASAVGAVRTALRRGDIVLHAFPHNAEAEFYPDASLFDSALALPQHLADDLGIARPTAVSQRDVPGWTRATLPLLRARGIEGISIGAGQPPGKPDTPQLFVWRDEASGADVVVTYESGYGAASRTPNAPAVVFVLPSGVAMAAGWHGDNVGPPAVADVASDWDTLEGMFPGAEVVASGLDPFFAEANRPSVKAQLPVVTADIGDGWIYGVPSDPVKVAQFREAARQRAACLAAGEQQQQQQQRRRRRQQPSRQQRRSARRRHAATAGEKTEVEDNEEDDNNRGVTGCNASSPGMRRFDRLLGKVPEHTWGVAMHVFLPDYANWSNAEFDRARAELQPAGFQRNASDHADYNTTVNSWVEQRRFVTDAPLRVVAGEQPALAASLAAAFDEIAHPAVPQTAGLVPVAGDPTAQVFSCTLGGGGGGGSGDGDGRSAAAAEVVQVSVGFDSRGAVTTLQVTPAGGDTAGGTTPPAGRRHRDGGSNHATAWASAAAPLGLYEYQTFDNEDFNVFLYDFASRVGGPGCGGYAPGSPDDLNCVNFRKPNVTSSHPRHRAVTPTLAKLWRSNGTTDRVTPNKHHHTKPAASAGACEFVLELDMDAEAHALAGAPERLVVSLTLSPAPPLPASGASASFSSSSSSSSFFSSSSSSSPSVAASVAAGAGTGVAASWEVFQIGKRPTRLPEAGFFSFTPLPAVAAPEGYRLQVLGSQGVRPDDVVGAPGATRNTTVYGGSPHLRCVEAVTWSGPASASSSSPPPSSSSPSSSPIAALQLNLTSLDVPTVALGTATPFPSPRDGPPDMRGGAHFNIFQNTWNTNYVLWTPFDPSETVLRSRFRLDLSGV